MKKKYLLIPILSILILMLVLTGCGNKSNLLSNAEDMFAEAEGMLDEVSLDDLEDTIETLESETTDDINLEEDSNKKETSMNEGEYLELLQATFLIDGMGVYVSLVDTFIENEDMGLPYQEGKGYLYIEGTLDNNLEEDKSLAQVLFLAGYDEFGDQLGDASSWIDSDGISHIIEAGGHSEFSILYMYNAETTFITLEFNPKYTESDNILFKVNVADVNEASTEAADSENEEMIQILTTMSNTILTGIEQGNFEEVVPYSSYAFIAPSLTINSSDCIYFEGYNWEDCSTCEDLNLWGEDSSGNFVELTCVDFFDTYINAYNFSTSIPEIKNERIAYFPELSDYQATHYVKYTSEDYVLYLIYEETYFNEFTLSGIATGIE